MDEHYLTRCKIFEGNSAEEVEEWFNDFFQGKQIITTNTFYVDSAENSWKCVVLYRVKSKEITPNINRFEKEEESYQDIPDDQKATEKQIKFLKQLGYKGSLNLTKRQAFEEIKQIKESKE